MRKRIIFICISILPFWVFINSNLLAVCHENPFKKDNAFALDSDTILIKYPKTFKTVLPNGLTVYLTENRHKENCADFWLINNVGAVLEEDTENGLAHFLEHMAFNGTKSFKGKQIVNYLEKIGLRFGYDFNAGTSTDYTQYNICNVPVKSVANSTDTVLSILYDWSCNISLEENEIDAERGVILEEWRTRMSPTRRANSEISKKIYENSKYAIRDVIGDTNVIKNVTRKDFENFYKKWYTPNLQAIIVAGDINKDSVIQKIKRIFYNKENGNSLIKPIYFILDNDDPIVAVVHENELNESLINTYYKVDKQQPWDSNEYWFKHYLACDIIRFTINNRLKLITSEPSNPFIYCLFRFAPFAGDKYSFNFMSSVKNGKEIEAFEVMTKEYQKMLRFGCTEKEIVAAKENIVKTLNRNIRNWANLSNEYYINYSKSNFLEGNPLPDFYYEKLLTDSLIDSVNNELIISMFNSTKGRNQIFTVISPSKLINEKTLLKIVDSLKRAKLDKWTENVIKKELKCELKEAGKIVSKHNDSNYLFYSFSGGINTIVNGNLPTNDDRIFLTIHSKLPEKTLQGENAVLLKLFVETINDSGISNLTQNEFKTYLSEKEVNYKFSLKNDMLEISYSGNKESIEDIFKIAHLHLKYLQIDSSVFCNIKQKKISQIGLSGNNWKNRVNDTIEQYLFNKNKLFSTCLHEQDIKMLSYCDIAKFRDYLFSNIPNPIIFFTGKMDEEKLEQLLISYFSQLSFNSKNNSGMSNGLNLNKFNNVKKVVKTITLDSQTPTSFFYNSNSGRIDFNIKNIILLDIAANILDIEFTDLIREKIGGTYSILISKSIDPPPYNCYSISSKFETNPTMLNVTSEAMKSKIKELSFSVNDIQLNKSKEYLRKTFKQNINSSYQIHKYLNEKYLFQIDYLRDYIKTLDSITNIDVVEFFKKMNKDPNLKIYINSSAPH